MLSGSPKPGSSGGSKAKARKNLFENAPYAAMKSSYAAGAIKNCVQELTAS